jgi:hypothetical protein
VQPRKHLTDQDFRLGTGDENTRLHLEVQLSEGLMAEYVLERLTTRATSEERSKSIELLACERALELEIELEPVDPEHVGQQVLGIETPRVDPFALQIVGAP